MQYCLAEPAIPSTISGAATRAELDANLRAMVCVPDPDLLAGVKAILDPVLDRTWPGGNWNA